MKDIDLKRFAEFGLRYPRVPSIEGYVTAGDCRLYFASFGEGMPVLLLHGGMGNSSHWAQQIDDLLNAGYRVVLMDTRGHGRSSAGIQAFSYRLLAEDILCLLTHLQMNRVILVGWSDGACAALELARVTPAFVLGVVFFACNVDPSGTLPFQMTETIQHCLTRHRLDFLNLTPTHDRFEDLQPRLEPMQKNEPNYSLQQLGQISVPVAVVQGDRDEFIRLDHAKSLSESLGHGYFETLEGLSHFAPIQDPGSFNRVMLKYIRLFTEGVKTID